MGNYTKCIESYLASFKEVLEKLKLEEINQVLDVIKEAYENEKTIFIMGNGGSASTASHISCDLNKTASLGLEKRIKVICLNDNVPLILAISNDIGYEFVFVEQLKNHLKIGDLVIGISGSGNSPNVLRAIDFANGKNCTTIGLCGYRGGKLKEKAKYCINVNVDDMQIAEDFHLIIGHVLTKILKVIISE